MWDRLRGWQQSAETRRLETISAYVDNALEPTARRRFEAELERDAALQADVARLRQLKAGLRQLPRPEVPRNFTLDPARYGRPARAPEVRLYPAFRLATALAGLLFVLAVIVTLLPQSSAQYTASLQAPAAALTPEVAQETMDTFSEEARVEVQAEKAADALPPEATDESAPGGFSITAAQTTPQPEPTATPLPSPTPLTTTSPEPKTSLLSPASSAARLVSLGGLFGALLVATLLLRRRLSP